VVPSEDVNVDQRSDIDGGIAVRGPPTTSGNDSASEAMMDLKVTQKKKWTNRSCKQLSMNSTGS
jgi:hypothetical protein